MIIRAKEKIQTTDSTMYIEKGDEAFISQSGVVYFNMFDATSHINKGPYMIAVVENFIDNKESLSDKWDISDLDNRIDDYRN